jgi:hypothetical protein
LYGCCYHLLVDLLAGPCYRFSADATSCHLMLIADQ